MTLTRRIDPRVLTPPLAHNDEDDRRFYRWDYPWPDFAPGPARPIAWSVTTLIDAGLPKYLGPHYAKMTADLALEAIAGHGRKQAKTLLPALAKLGKAWVLDKKAKGELTSIKPEKLTERDFAYRWLSGAAPRYRDLRADQGSAIHSEAEDLILARIGELIAQGETDDDGRLELGPLPEYNSDIASRMQAFHTWCNKFRPRFNLTEATVFSHHGYAGTLDAGIEIYVVGPGETEPRWWSVCVDWKSGRAVYPDVALQLSAYTRADFVGLPDGRAFPLPAFEASAVLHLTPEGPMFRWVDTCDDVYTVFLNACEVGRFRLPSPEYERGMAATVIGAEIQPGREMG